MMKTCQNCSRQFEITEEDLRCCKKIGCDPQDLCFDCSQKGRLYFRNERVLYTRKCDGTGETIVSIYAPDRPFKVYKSDYWYGDQWDPLSYGKEFDFSKTFFEQFMELHLAVPRIALINLKAENSDYCNMCIGNKNCYLIMGGDFNQDCMYGTLCMHNSDSLDIDYSSRNEFCYMMDNSVKCYGSQFVWDSKNCNNCAFITDCSGCTECILCSNLANKSYCIENVQYSKQEYLEKKKQILDGSYRRQQDNWEKFLELRRKRIAKYGHILGCENCSGDYLQNSKNCQNCFDVSESEDVQNCILGIKARDCYDNSFMGHESELIWNSMCVLGSRNVKGTYFGFNCSEVEYSEQIISSQNVFGCNGLHKKQYCILNKQYSKEDYEALRTRIIEHMKKTGEWGKFLPKEFSCFSYNESTALRYFPLTRDEALKQGFQWRNDELKSYQEQTVAIPDDIHEVRETITREMLACDDCKKNFKIVPLELNFYRKINVPVPHQCADCRQKQRMSLRTRFTIYDRPCMKCGTSMKTTYAPDRPETVYCEPCYLKTIY